MAQSPAQETATGQKRGPGRPPKAATPAMKKLKTSVSAFTPTTASPSTRSPAVDSPGPSRTGAGLPLKISDSKPLPTLPEPQSVSLSNDEYQSIAGSTVLAASLERSKQRWSCEGIFQRYWVKPETGKNAKPPAPNNPETKWMKMEGPCRIRIEPHIFEADVYIEKKPKPPPQKPPPPAIHNAYGTPYRVPSPAQPQCGQHQHHQPYQNRAVPSMGNNGTPQTPLNGPPPPMPGAKRSTGTPQPPPASEKKADPVISMLASRASSDPELKGLMKEVATGNATQAQLRIFQRHIDELTAIIQKQRKEEGDHSIQQQQRQQSNLIQYDGSSDARPSLQPPPEQQRQYPMPQPAPATPYQHQTYTPPPPPPPVGSPPVILGFTTPGATEDRFLFPQHTILESLSPQHSLASFIVTRRGREAADPSGLDPDQEYWQPITVMLEVAYGREEILAHIRRWVQPPDVVRTAMEAVMSRCRRAPSTHLALRLPIKGSVAAAAAVPESGVTSKEATPIVEQSGKLKSALKSARRTSTTKTATATPSMKKAGAAQAKTTPSAAAQSRSEMPPPGETGQATPGAMNTDGGTDETPTTESGRPKRAVRKSVRISEG